MENNIAERKQKIEDMTPGFGLLEKQFDERTEEYEKQKKSIVGMWRPVISYWQYTPPTLGGHLVYNVVQALNAHIIFIIALFLYLC